MPDDLSKDTSWTPSHDLALLGVTLAYGTDGSLHDREVEALTHMLQRWHHTDTPEAVREVVVEATAVFFEAEGRREVRRAVMALRDAFDDQQRRRALLDMMRIAEADGVLLEGEQTLVAMLAEAWGLKALGQTLVEDTKAERVEAAREEAWDLMHELAFVYIILAHSTDNDLSRPEIDTIVARLQEWHPDLDDEGARDVMRDVLRVYAEQHDAETVSGAVAAVKAALPRIQRLAAVDDLYAIARADGVVVEAERTMIAQLADAWDVPVRLNGEA
jgi:uncharacterized tellurite resistance protein B-like protein